MTFTRRKFIKAGTIAALLAAATVDKLPRASAQQRGQVAPEPAPVTVGEESGESQFDPTSYLKKSSFTPYLNTKFYVSDAASRVTLTLVEVSALRQASRMPNMSPEVAAEDAFSLVFRGARGASLPQGIYTFEHDALGQLSLFLVPINRAGGRGYFGEVIINRLRP